jgi:hypothetical protein
MTAKPSSALYVVGHEIPNTGAFTSCISNFKLAHSKRIEPAAMTRKARLDVHDKKIRDAYAALTLLLTGPLIQKHADELFHLQGMASSKWTEERFVNAMAAVFETYDRSKLAKAYKGFIKRETSVLSKNKPRIVVDLGDARQLMCLAVVCVLEHALFEVFDKSSIKYRDRTTVLRDWIEEAEKDIPIGEYVEGDGTAFDAHVNDIFLEEEEKLLNHVMKELWWYDFAIPVSWCSEEAKAGTKGAFIRVSTQTLWCRIDVEYVRFAAQRFSGVRWTSSFNWIVNLVCWAVCLSGKDVWDFIATVAQGQGYASYQNWRVPIRLIFEGDDSLIRYSVKADHAWKTIVSRSQTTWQEMGFDMKLVPSIVGGKTVVEFCGLHAPVKSGRVELARGSPVVFPDCMRTFVGCNYMKQEPEGDANAAAEVMLRSRASEVRAFPFLHHYVTTLADHHESQKRTYCTDKAVHREAAFHLTYELSDEYYDECWRVYKSSQHTRTSRFDSVTEDLLETVTADSVRGEHVKLALWSSSTGAGSPVAGVQTV